MSSEWLKWVQTHKRGFTATEFSILDQIAKWHTNKPVKVSLRSLAKHTGLHRNSVLLNLTRLHEKGALTWQRGQRGQVSYVVLNVADEVAQEVAEKSDPASDPASGTVCHLRTRNVPLLAQQVCREERKNTMNTDELKVTLSEILSELKKTNELLTAQLAVQNQAHGPGGEIAPGFARPAGRSEPPPKVIRFPWQRAEAEGRPLTQAEKAERERKLDYWRNTPEGREEYAAMIAEIREGRERGEG